ncbi:MAG: competence protein TfoX [Solobacterium sp.]|nr:competence protein TfoX [Solobacterium sp.]MBQ6531967.1 competence protein TfoX [Solobacterium sp.]MBR0214777.1 competence protein TfoX [Solobacterium sp.]
MPSTKAYLDYISEQLSGLDDVRFRPMMGEYLLYYCDRLAGGIYDDRLLVKPVPSALKMMPGAPKEIPYEGAKEMLLVKEVDNREFLCELLQVMWPELPDRKKKTRSRH